ncbi:MAG: phosphoglycerate dehydrogenase [Thermoplasmatales archaeon]|nr:phosphoglycerate dehydrogenase [Thermoplasmatales archaeon]
MRILVSDPLSEEGLRILEKSGIPVDVRTGLDEEGLCAAIGGYDGLIIRSGTKVTAKVIEAADRLKVIGRAGVGVDNIDVQAATQKGILVMNTPAANIISAAEHSCALIMSMVRNIPWAHASMHDGKWERGKFTGTELNGKTLGIIGVGRVGGEVAKRLKHFNMKLVGYDPFLPEEVAENLGVRLTSLEELLRVSDIMTIHTPLLPETRNMISKEQFGMMKPTAMLVNVARGGIVNERDLYEALKTKRIAAAAFDVWVNEPLSGEEKALLELDNLITTPHLGASTQEAQERVAVEIAESAVKFLTSGEVSNAINAPKGQLDPETAPYVPLAEALGTIAHGLNGNKPVDRLEIVFRGALASKDTKRLGVHVLIGMLRNIVGDDVNMVNASGIAKGKGISVVESKEEESHAYDSTLVVRVRSGKGVRTVRGTVFAETPRLVGIDGYSFEMPIVDNMLFTAYKDKPGVIGMVGKVLGDANVNIGMMSVGRDEPMGNAVMVLGVDQEIPAGVMEKLRGEVPLERTLFVNLG